MRAAALQVIALPLACACSQTAFSGVTGDLA